MWLCFLLLLSMSMCFIIFKMSSVTRTVSCTVSLLFEGRGVGHGAALDNPEVCCFCCSAQMFMAFTLMVLRAKKESQNRVEREREREKDTVNINAQRDRDRRKRGKKCCWDAASAHSIQLRLNSAPPRPSRTADMNVWSYSTAGCSSRCAWGSTVCQHWMQVAARRSHDLKDHSGVYASFFSF